MCSWSPLETVPIAAFSPLPSPALASDYLLNRNISRTVPIVRSAQKLNAAGADGAAPNRVLLRKPPNPTTHRKQLGRQRRPAAGADGAAPNGWVGWLGCRYAPFVTGLSFESEAAESAHDAVLVLSFGGPERSEDVVPFLRNVTRGRNVPEDRLSEVAEQYEMFGGRSPINDQCRSLIAALEHELADHAINLPIYWGNRNWTPYVTDTVQQMADDGIKRAVVFVTSAFGSYSGCRQYRENLEAARNEVNNPPALEKLRLYYNHPGFIEPLADNLTASLTQRPIAERRVVFTAHSIPTSMAQSCSYEEQLNEAARLVMNQAGLRPDFDLVYQSRSGPPTMPWLEPDVNDHLRDLATQGTKAVAVVPLGFISDHMEVMFDLDTQAADTAKDLDLDYIRVPTVGIAPRFVSMIRELVQEQLDSSVKKLWLGSDGPWPANCPDNHCMAPRRPSPSKTNNIA